MRVKKQWENYTMEYYWAIKRDKLLIYSTTWMILKSITLVMTEDPKESIIPIIKNSGKVKTVITERG